MGYRKPPYLGKRLPRLPRHLGQHEHLAHPYRERPSPRFQHACHRIWRSRAKLCTNFLDGRPLAGGDERVGRCTDLLLRDAFGHFRCLLDRRPAPALTYYEA